jgi:hypothetical protein
MGPDAETISLEIAEKWAGGYAIPVSNEYNIVERLSIGTALI